MLTLNAHQGTCMAAQQGNEDPATFNHRVGRATILGLRVAVVSVVVAIAAIVIGIFQPQIQAWFKDEHPGIPAFFSGVKAWLTIPWTLPWTGWIAIIAATYGLGLLSVLAARSEHAMDWLLKMLKSIALSFNPYMGRNENVPPEQPLSREEEDEIAMAALAVPLPTAPELEEMDAEQQAVLSQMALRVRGAKAAQIAFSLDLLEVTVLAALHQLQAWGLVTSDLTSWELTKSGIAYVYKYKAILLSRDTP